MDKKPNERAASLQANRILYLVIIGVLCLAAIIVGITAALRRPAGTNLPSLAPSNESTEQPSENGTQDPAPESSATPPALESPVSGNVNKKHDLSVLVQSITMGDWRVHSGLDIAASLGTNVLAAADGTVEKVWQDPLMGTCVSITHEGELTTVYQNLHETLATGIVPGAKIKKGDTVGAIGETALIECAEEPHLHFEVLLKNEKVDPLDYITKESQAASLTFDEDEGYEG